MSFLIPGYKSTVKTTAAQRSLENTLNYKKNRQVAFQNFIVSCIPIINKEIDTYSNLGCTKIVIRISTNGSIQLSSSETNSQLIPNRSDISNSEFDEWKKFILEYFSNPDNGYVIGIQQDSYVKNDEGQLITIDWSKAESIN